MLHVASVSHTCPGLVSHPCSPLPRVCRGHPRPPWVPARARLKAAPCPALGFHRWPPAHPLPAASPDPPGQGWGGCGHPQGGHKGTKGVLRHLLTPPNPGPTAILGMYTLMSNKQYYDAICSGTISNTEGINSECLGDTGTGDTGTIPSGQGTWGPWGCPGGI